MHLNTEVEVVENAKTGMLMPFPDPRPFYIDGNTYSMIYLEGDALDLQVSLDFPLTAQVVKLFDS